MKETAHQARQKDSELLQKHLNDLTRVLNALEKVYEQVEKVETGIKEKNKWVVKNILLVFL